MQGKWLLFGGCVLFAAAGAGALVYWRGHTPPPQQVVQAQAELPAGAEVRLSGRVQAVNVLKVGAPIGGVAEEFPFKPGDEVYEGQIIGRIANNILTENEHEAVLELERAQMRMNALESDLIAARLEQSRTEAEVSRARIDLQRAERAFQRQTLLNKEGATPRNTFEKSQQELEIAQKDAGTAEAMNSGIRDKVDKAIRDIDMAKKELAEKVQSHGSAKAQLDSATILAPADGLIIAIRKSAGEEVPQSMEDLIEIATDLSQLELVVEAEPSIAKRIQAGQAAMLQLADVPGEGLPAKVKSVEDRKIVIEFSSPTTLIRPGNTGVARLKLN